MARLSGSGIFRKRFYVNDSNRMEMRTGEITLQDCVMKTRFKDFHPGRGLPAGELVRESVNAYLPGRSRTTLNFLPHAEVRRPGSH
jgi:hypothetical protein